MSDDLQWMDLISISQDGEFGVSGLISILVVNEMLTLYRIVLTGYSKANQPWISTPRFRSAPLRTCLKGRRLVHTKRFRTQRRLVRTTQRNMVCEGSQVFSKRETKIITDIQAVKATIASEVLISNSSKRHSQSSSSVIFSYHLTWMDVEPIAPFSTLFPSPLLLLILPRHQPHITNTNQTPPSTPKITKFLTKECACTTVPIPTS